MRYVQKCTQQQKWQKRENVGELANMAKMTILPQSPPRQSTKQWRGPIKVGGSGEFGKYGENDNFAKIANQAKHKAMRGPIKVGECGEIGKYGKNDNFATIANKAKHKAMRGAHKSWRKWQFCHNRQPGKAQSLSNLITHSLKLCISIY